MWFKELTGFDDISHEYVKRHLKVNNDKLISLVNNREMTYGRLEITTLKKLKEDFSGYPKGKIQIQEVIGDIKDIHCDERNSNALFQVASQFNLLEMVSPNISPEDGISRYEYDRTQGPTCAIACGAGTIYRNYFANINGKIGQTVNNQIDCLELIGAIFNNDELNLWKMKNGYALISKEGLAYINDYLSNLTLSDIDQIKNKLKIGIQWQTEVTLSNNKHNVSQVYCSALPVGYSQISSIYWEPFARLILEASYEATILAGLNNIASHKSNIIYLTLLGGGVFGNEPNWIIQSLSKVINKYKNSPLDLRVVSYGQPNRLLSRLIQTIKENI